MKKYLVSALIFCLGLNLLAQEDDPILMIVAGEEIRKSEFLYIYNKNNANNPIDRRELSEYVQLFVDLKLKVAEARAFGLDTTEAFITGFQNYRSQSAERYLRDAEFEEEMIQRAYNRFQYELNVSHILIRTTQQDTLEAYNRARAIRQRLNREPFDVVAIETSEDRVTAPQGGHIGFITAFATVLPFEDAAYSLAVGEISQPVRSNFGYHIIKLNSKRPSQGSVHVAHIMKTFPVVQPEVIERARRRIDTIYTRLLAGEDFETLARETSDHAPSARVGGELGWYSLGRSGLGEDFEEAGFALNIGEFSAPVRTHNRGYHIIKLLDRRPLASLEEKRPQIERYFERGDRRELLETNFRNKLRRENNLQVIQAGLREIENIAGNSAVIDSTFLANARNLNNPLFTFADKIYFQNQFIEYLEVNINRPLAVEALLNNFIDSRLLAHADSQLENRFPEFRMLMQEYIDGMLMFEIASRKVWNRAIEDREGLENFFEANKHNYTWDTPRFRGMIVHAKDRRTARQARRIIRTSSAETVAANLRVLNTDGATNIRTQAGIFIKGENEAVDRLVFREGNFSPSEELPVVFVARGGRVLEHGPELYSDIRGIVISDFQNYLRENWVNELRERFTVVIFEDVLNTIKENYESLVR